MGKSIEKSVAQVGLERDVRAESLGTEVAERRKRKARSQGERSAILAGNFGGVEEKEFVNDTGGQGSAVERRARFQQNAEDIAAAQFRKDGTLIETTVFCFELDDFDSGVL